MQVVPVPAPVLAPMSTLTPAPAMAPIVPLHSDRDDQIRHDLETANAELREINEQLQNEVIICIYIW